MTAPPPMQWIARAVRRPTTMSWSSPHLLRACPWQVRPSLMMGLASLSIAVVRRLPVTPACCPLE